MIDERLGSDYKEQEEFISKGFIYYHLQRGETNLNTRSSKNLSQKKRIRREKGP